MSATKTNLVSSPQLRAFHVTGQGLDSWAPTGPMRPAILGDAAVAEPPATGDLLELYAHALREQRGKARARFNENVRYCRDRMQELLALDDSRDPAVSRSTGAVSASLGRGGMSFIDTSALASVLRTSSSNPVARMDAPRRARCEATLAALNVYLMEAGSAPLFWEFPSANAGALTFCEHQLEKLSATLRALRVARLEMDAAYEPAVHDDAIARFTWESADAEELYAMPAVLVLDTADRTCENSFTSFGRLLRSGLPIQVLIQAPEFYTGDLAFLAVAHREAFAMQSALACPEHLNEGLLDMTHALRPAVAVIGIADSALFADSRAFPMFVYDPEGGEDWIQRFRLYKKPLPHEGLNAVHVAALSPSMCSSQFRIVPKEGWAGDQMELGEYLRQFAKQPPLAIPYILVHDPAGGGEPQRAVVTRDLVLLARDRIRAWKLFDELSEAGKPPIPVVDTEKLKQDVARSVKDDTLLRVVALLQGGGGAPPAATTVAAAAPVPTATTAVAEASAVVEDPYIESGLCTSCNDCMKVNSRMFVYNSEKQAMISDPGLGTFAELVRAAEGCPARCIHPGTPRAGDRTATPQLVTRAAKFN